MRKEQHFDIHQHITDQIVAAIESGAGEFRLPWHRAGGNIMRPVNVASKKRYRGVNVLALWATAEESGYTSGTWGTYKQWAESGAQVRKGEKAAFIVFYKELEYAAESETGDGETTTRLFARATPVFAAEQVDGYQAPVNDAPPATPITPDRAGGNVCCRDGCRYQSRRRPGFLSPVNRQYPVAPARILRRHAGGILLFGPAS
jgi:antirestriction protein ArdC